MVRRAALAVLVAALSLAGAACSTADGQRAVELLERAQAAQEEIESATFGVRVWGEVEGQRVEVRMDGGGYLQGERAGDFYLRGRVEVPGTPPTSFQLVTAGGSAFVELGGVWQELPAPAQPSAAETDALEAQLAGFDFTRYVTDVRVTSGTEFLGEPVTKIVGVVDTAGLFEGLLGELGGFEGLGGFADAGLADEVRKHLGDTRAVLYVSDVTNLLRAALVTIAFEDQGQTFELHLDYALRTVDEPVEIPTPAAVAA